MKEGKGEVKCAEQRRSLVLCTNRVSFSGCLEAFGGLGGFLISRREHQNHL